MTPIRQNYVSIRSVLPFITIPRSEWEEDLAIEYAAQAYDTALGIKSATYDAKVTLIKIDNYKGKLPNGYRRIEAVAYMWDQPTDDEVKGFEDTEDTDPLAINPINDPDYTFNQDDVTRIQSQGIVNNYNLYTGLWEAIIRQRGFTILRPIDDPFTRGRHCTWCPNLQSTCDDTYTIKKDGTIITSVESGYLCVAYLGEPYDEKGDLLIIDDSDVQNALATYVMFKLWETKMHMHEQNAMNIRLMYLNEWERLATKVKGKIKLKTLDSKAIAAYQHRFHYMVSRSTNWNDNYGIIV